MFLKAKILGLYYWCTDGTVLLVHRLYWVFAFYVLEPMDCLSQPPTDLLLDTHLAIPMVSDSNSQWLRANGASPPEFDNFGLKMAFSKCCQHFLCPYEGFRKLPRGVLSLWCNFSEQLFWMLSQTRIFHFPGFNGQGWGLLSGIPPTPLPLE